MTKEEEMQLLTYVVGINDLIVNSQKERNKSIYFTKFSDFRDILKSQNLEASEDNQFKNTDLKADKKEDKVPPKYSDGSFRQKKSGIYEYRFMHENKQISVYSNTKEDCWNKRTNIIAGKVKNKSNNINISFGDWAVKWYNLYKTRKDGSLVNPNNKKYIDLNICQSIGKTPLRRLTGLQIQEFLKSFEDRGNTRDKLAKLIKSCLESAVDNGLIKNNPFKAVKYEKHTPESYNVLQPSEQNKIYNSIKNPEYLKLFMFCCCTGMRIGEALTINIKNDIDIINNKITVNLEDTSTKKHKKTIPYLPELLGELPEREMLFTKSINAAQIYFTKLFKKLNIDAVVHSFRHTFVSCCYHVGFKDKQIQIWAGHSTIKTTMDTYTHIIENEGSPIIAYLEKLKITLKL